jgi:hypothetical protein
VRIVGLERDLVDPNGMSRLDAERIFKEAAVDPTGNPGAGRIGELRWMLDTALPTRQIRSIRSRTYGIHPIWLSENANFRLGNRWRCPENTQSVKASCALKLSPDWRTRGGASGELVAIDDEDPMWMQITTPASSQACNRGSQ